MLTLPLKVSIFTVLIVGCASAFAQTEAAASVTPDTATPQIAADGTDPTLSAEEHRIREEEESLADAVAQKERDARSGVAIAGRVSTLGFGVELITSVSKRVNLRAQGNFFDISQGITKDDISYQGRLNLQTFGVLADFHPFAGGFRISVGGYQNGNKINLDARCKTDCKIGKVGDLEISNNTSAGDNGRLFGGIKFNSVAPYVGLGFGNAMRGWPVHFGFDIGVLLQGSPKVNLGADGVATVKDTTNNMTTRPNLATDPTVQDNLKKEARKAEGDSKEFKYYPVINFTIGYRFKF